MVLCLQDTQYKFTSPLVHESVRGLFVSVLLCPLTPLIAVRRR